MLLQVCVLTTAQCAGYGCVVGDASLISAGSGNMGLACLQALADKDNFDELQYYLYIKEIQRLNPSLREGCLFVDGLYELVCSRLPVQVGKDANLKNSARDLLTLNTSDILLLQKYWHRPHDPNEYTAYLTVATSFVHYILTKFGPQGVSEILQHLDYTMDDPLAEKFHFRGQDILKLEFKWKKFVEAEVNANFRLSVLGMLHILFTRYLLSYWLRLLIVLILILADVGLEFLYSLAFAQLISLGFSRGTINLEDLFQWVSVLITTLIVRFVVLLVSAGVLVSMAVSISNRIRNALSIRLSHVTPLYLTDHSSGSLLMTFSQDVNVVEKIISTALRAIAAALVLVVACSIFCAVILWPLAIYLIGLFIVSQVLNNIVSNKLNMYLFTKGQANGKLCDILKERIDGFYVNRIYNLAGLWKGQLQEAMDSYYTNQARKAMFFTNFSWFFQQMVPNISIATMLFGIILLSREGYTDFTTGISVFLFYIRVSVGLTAAASMFPELQLASTAMGRINALLNDKTHDISLGNEPEYHKSIDDSFEEPPPTGVVPSLPIQFRGVCFSYKMSAAHWNLYNVSLEIKAGERVVIVGTTGSGKSTLLTLAMQLYTPTIGEVVLGGGKSPFYHGRPKVSTTFQNNHMFNMSLRENIRLGNLAASNEEVEEAAIKADIHDWIMSQARGYDTPVQSGGSSLSGGQRQRIAIARMLVAKSPVCLLDEVTSALDPLTEVRVFSKLMEVTKGRTVLAITHKLEQAKFFDRIIVLSHGRVKEMGSHSGLLAHRGTYWRMCHNDATVSPGGPVSIPRRRSSGTLQGETPLQPPELSIVPLSSPREIPDGVYPTPAFVPLQPLIETGESRSTHTISRIDLAGGCSHNSMSSGTVILPAITVTSAKGNAVIRQGIPPIGDPTNESIEDHSSLPRRSSTPIVCAKGHPGMRSDTVSNDSATLISVTKSPDLLPVPEVCVETAASTDQLQVPGEIASKSMEEPPHQEGIVPAPIAQAFDANQTLPSRLIVTHSGTGLRRYPNLQIHRSTHNEPLGPQLENVLKYNSMESLASFFKIELKDLLLLENAKSQTRGIEGRENGGTEEKQL